MSAKKEGIVEFYLRHADKFRRTYGDLTIVLLESGHFFEVYDTQPPEDSPHLRCCRDVLGILVTRKDKSDVKSAYMAGIPSHSVRRYLKGLLRARYTVVVMTQITPPPNVIREVTKILSPGCTLSEDVNDSSEAGQSALLALLIEEDADGECYGHACRFDTNLGTLEMRSVHGSDGGNGDSDELFGSLKEVLDGWQYHEVLLRVLPRANEGRDAMTSDEWRARLERALGLRDTLVHFELLDGRAAYRMSSTFQKQFLERHFAHYHTIFDTIQESLGLQHTERASVANLIGLLEFVERHDSALIQRLPRPSHVGGGGDGAGTTDPMGGNVDYLQPYNEVYDKLNIFDCHGDASRSLFQYCNFTRSKMGERLLRQRLAQPLLDCAELESRYSLVDDVLDVHGGPPEASSWSPSPPLTFLHGVLHMTDLERVYRRFSIGKLHPHEVPRVVASNENVLRLLRYINQHAPRLPSIANLVPDGDTSARFAAYNQELRDLFDLDVCKESSLSNLSARPIFCPGVEPLIDDLAAQHAAETAAIDAIVVALTRYVASSSNGGGHHAAEPIRVHVNDKDGHWLDISRIRGMKLQKAIAALVGDEREQLESVLEVSIDKLEFNRQNKSNIKIRCPRVRTASAHLLELQTRLAAETRERFAVTLAKLNEHVDSTRLVSGEDYTLVLTASYNFLPSYLPTSYIR